MKSDIENATIEMEPLPKSVKGRVVWADLTIKAGEYTHGSFAKVVWRIEGEDKSPECEETVERIITA
jgi:hypothetical protein